MEQTKMNREQIMNLKVGDPIERSLLGNGQWERTTVTQIFGRGVNVKGNAYVCLYTAFGMSAEMSGSAIESDKGQYFRLPQ
jgi:hypothetical protein